MRVYRLSLLLSLLTLGCAATLTISPTATAFQRLELRERAGLFPGDWVVTGSVHASQLAALEQWSAKQGIVIAPAGIGGKNLLGFSGYSRMLGWTILINSDLSPDARLYTLLHELGHVLGPHDLSDEGGEVIAELVAAQTCANLGFDVWGQTAAYLHASVPLDVQVATVQAYQATIDRLVVVLVQAAR